MLINDLNQTIDHWIAALAQYSDKDFCARPAVNGWSIGQVYMHLLCDTRYYLEQVLYCIEHNDHGEEPALPAANRLLTDNAFPDLVLQGPPGALPPIQPVNNAELKQSLQLLQKDINEIYALVAISKCQGKTAHPGFGYLNAREWLQFAAMHFRHHLRQKKRIDDFLGF